MVVEFLKIDRRRFAKFWPRIAHLLVCLIEEFPVFGLFSLIFLAVPPWKLGHSPNKLSSSDMNSKKLSSLQV